MGSILEPTNLELLFIFGLSLIVAGIAWRNRPRRGTVSLAAFMVVVAVWVGAHLLAHLTPATTFFRQLRWMGIGTVAFVWFVFVLAYTGRESLLTTRVLAVLFAWPVGLNVLLWAPDFVGVFGFDLGFDIWSGLREGTNLFSWVHVGLSYALFAVGSVLLLVFVRHRHRIFRRQALSIVAGIATLWAGSAVTVFELFGDLHVHFLPAGLVLTGVAFGWATTRGRLTELVPVAASAVLETMDAGVIVADADGRLVELNPKARSLLDVSATADLVGEPLDVILGDAAGQWDGPSAGKPGEDVVVETIEIGESQVQVHISPLASRKGVLTGSVYVLTDVTERRRREAELRRQNERLDEFASIISHDLRNPLNVATSRLALARDEVESDHLEDVARALDRIEGMTDETLTLARAGQMVDPATMAHVSIEAVARAAWETVETDDATLTVRDDTILEADESRLQHVFENLLRNAVEHGDGAVSVTVGRLEDGFYVEDDGSGIPPGEREDVFEAGYSTADTGTGFGLKIVREVLDAHGWEISVTDGAAGGARFEITGVGAVD